LHAGNRKCINAGAMCLADGHKQMLQLRGTTLGKMIADPGMEAKNFQRKELQMGANDG
jgi:hypothetical protein